MLCNRAMLNYLVPTVFTDPSFFDDAFTLDGGNRRTVIGMYCVPFGFICVLYGVDSEILY